MQSATSQGMTTPQVDNGRAPKARRAKVDPARRAAFEQLCEEVEEQRQAAWIELKAAKYASWKGAAKRFKGLSDELRLRIEMRNIFAEENGYAVSFTRHGETFSRRFYGKTEATLDAAVEFRDKALKVLGELRDRAVPARVLKTLRLPAAVPNIYHSGKAYVAHLGKGKTQTFSFAYVAEEDAYAMAIASLEENLRTKAAKGRPPGKNARGCGTAAA